MGHVTSSVTSGPNNETPEYCLQQCVVVAVQVSFCDEFHRKGAFSCGCQV